MIQFFQKIFQKSSFQVYTDGSQKKDWGSWAFVILKNNKIIYENSGRKRHASSNQMEFQAALNAINFLPSGADAELFTDSRILIRTIKGEMRPKAFENLTHELNVLLSDRKISWRWVKAHSGNPFNERCDELCIIAREAKN
jgi:ribonuclease HI